MQGWSPLEKEKGNQQFPEIDMQTTSVMIIALESGDPMKPDSPTLRRRHPSRRRAWGEVEFTALGRLGVNQATTKPVDVKMLVEGPTNSNWSSGTNDCPRMIGDGEVSDPVEAPELQY